MPRWLPIALAALLALACSEPERAAKPTPAGAQADAEAEGPPTGAQWWSSARSLNEGNDADEAAADDPRALVQCRLGSGKRFMRRGDCLVQGGRPEGA